MKLYHFTCVEHLDSILNTGLYRGEVCTKDFRRPSLSAVWLTSDNDPSGHGLSGEWVPTEGEREKIRLLTGEIMPENMKFPNKRAVKIAVDIQARDENLFRWTRWALKNVNPVVRDALIDSGGGMAKARTWYVYFGLITPERFAAVEVDGIPYTVEAQEAA